MSEDIKKSSSSINNLNKRIGEMDTKMDKMKEEMYKMNEEMNNKMLSNIKEEMKDLRNLLQKKLIV
jgi:uncharacterized coiled-coil protein SlyX